MLKFYFPNPQCGKCKFHGVVVVELEEAERRITLSSSDLCHWWRCYQQSQGPSRRCQPVRNLECCGATDRSRQQCSDSLVPTTKFHSFLSQWWTVWRSGRWPSRDLNKINPKISTIFWREENCINRRVSNRPAVCNVILSIWNCFWKKI